MATWREASLECRTAAKTLLTADYLRSSINRSYYAAYAPLSGRLEGKVVYKEGRSNPDHADLQAYILRNLDALSRETRFELVKAIGRLWKARVLADYIPAAYVDRSIAINALRDANTVLLAMEIQDE